MLSSDQITEAIRENGGSIEFIRFESDVDGTAENEQGPWSYKNATKCFVVYRSGDNEKRILLKNMIKRGRVLPSACSSARSSPVRRLLLATNASRSPECL